jgi:hypothetical protein
MTAKKMSPRKEAKKQEEAYVWPKKLSKAGEWRKANPNGLEVIYCDMRAVMK